MSIDSKSEEWLNRASSEPVQVLAEAEPQLKDIVDPDSRSVAYRAMAIAARNCSDLDRSITYGQTAAESALDNTVRLEALGTLSGSLSMAGRSTEALEILERAMETARGLIAAQLTFQKGLVLTVLGDYETALTLFDAALGTFRQEDDSGFVSMTLHNLGYVYTQTGRLDEAAAALTEAREIEESAGRYLEVSGIDHNLGLLASYQGDIPEALRRLTMSDELHMRQTGDEVPRHVTRSEILMSVGLYRSALALAKEVAAGARNKGRADDEADALLVAARAALLSDELEEASSLATAAADAFRSQGREAWVAHADLVEVEAAYRLAGASKSLRDRARGAAYSLEESGFQVASMRSRILAARISIEDGDVEAALSDFNIIGQQRSGPVELKVQRWHATSLLRLALHDTRGADSAARAGLNLLEDSQAALGASDVRSGIERLGEDLGLIGLRLAVESGNARRVFRWMERTRARSLRYQPVVPREGEPDHELLVELRKVSADLRQPALQADRDLLRRRRQLQDGLRRSTHKRNRGSEKSSGFSMEALSTALGDKALVEFGALDGRLVVVVAHQGRFRLRNLRAAEETMSSLGRLRFELRRTARLGRPPDGVRRMVERFGDEVFAGVGLPADDVVVVPPGPLMAAPWAALPQLAGRRVTVAPSAEVWWRAEQLQPGGAGVVLASGPDLEYAEAEIDKLRLIHPLSTILDPEASSDLFGAAVKEASIAHVASHAHFEVENPMFSSLRLGDGDFNIYDLERLGQAPDLIVLSACDSGYTETRAGDELAGLTSALLSMGSKSVVASVGLVPDTEATTELMVQFHTGIAAGNSSAHALSKAQTSLLEDPDGYVAAASFLCIGAG